MSTTLFCIKYLFKTFVNFVYLSTTSGCIIIQFYFIYYLLLTTHICFMTSYLLFYFFYFFSSKGLWWRCFSRMYVHQTNKNGTVNSQFSFFLIYKIIYIFNTFIQLIFSSLSHSNFSFFITLNKFFITSYHLIEIFYFLQMKMAVLTISCDF